MAACRRPARQRLRLGRHQLPVAAALRARPQPRPREQRGAVPGRGRGQLAAAHLAGGPAPLRAVLGPAGGRALGLEPRARAGALPVPAARDGAGVRAVPVLRPPAGTGGAPPAGEDGAWSAWERALVAGFATLLCVGPAGLHRHLPSPVEHDVPPEAEPRGGPGALPAGPARLRAHPRLARPDRRRAAPPPDGMGLRPPHGLRRRRARGVRGVVAPGPPGRGGARYAGRAGGDRRQRPHRQPLPRDAARRLPVPRQEPGHDDQPALAAPARDDRPRRLALPARALGRGRRLPARRPPGPPVGGAGGGRLPHLGRLPRSERPAVGAGEGRDLPLAALPDRRLRGHRGLGPRAARRPLDLTAVAGRGAGGRGWRSSPCPGRCPTGGTRRAWTRTFPARCARYPSRSGARPTSCASARSGARWWPGTTTSRDGWARWARGVSCWAITCTRRRTGRAARPSSSSWSAARTPRGAGPRPRPTASATSW